VPGLRSKFVDRSPAASRNAASWVGCTPSTRIWEIDGVATKNNSYSTNRQHIDDGSVGNLSTISDFNTIVNGRNVAAGGSAVIGTSTAAMANAADAHFLATSINYGVTSTLSNDLGHTTVNVAAGGSTSGLTDNNSNLYRFLDYNGTGGDGHSLVVNQGITNATGKGLGPTSGLGNTSDAEIRLTGDAYLNAGVYDIRITGDDGFRLQLDGHTVAYNDSNHAPTTNVYTGVAVTGGLTPLELLYWDQAGQAQMTVEFKLSGSADTTYQVLGTNNMALFSEANAPTLSETQDIIAGSTSGTYQVRTGSTIDGGAGNDHITGGTANDMLKGGTGNDVLGGGAGNDVLIGGKGDDTLTGGLGHDVFRWQLGDAGSAGTPAHDVISDFDNASFSGDVLDLRDLLAGETHAANSYSLPSSIGGTNALTTTPDHGNLASFLHFSTSGSDTVVSISTTGGFSGGFNNGAVDQVVTLTGVNLVGSFTSDNQVLDDLLKRGKLVTDGS